MSDPSAPAPVEAPVPVKVGIKTEATTTEGTATEGTATEGTAAPTAAAAPVAPPTAPSENEQGDPPDAPDASDDSAPPVSGVSSNVQVHLPLEEFAEDLDLRLGRANGNIYQRKPGVDGIHDGQVMVRLKKKRFIVIEYGIVPNEHDLQASAMSPHINVPLGGGVTKCTGKVTSEPATPGSATNANANANANASSPLVACKKIGVPILMYDSEPDQPPSLYLRSGLCFTCQRNLNEKRRTQRKRPSERANHQAAAKVSANAQQSQAAFLAAQQVAGVTFPGVGMGMNGHPLNGIGGIPNNIITNNNPGSTTNLPGMQTVRIGGIGAQANLVGAGTTGRVNATPHHRVLMAVTNGHKKIKLAHTNSPLVLAPDAIILNGPPDNHSCKSVRGGHGFAEIGADLNVEVHQSLQSTQSLLHSVHTPEMMQHGIPPPTPDEISQTYDQAFYSLSKSLYLLVQWKTSWDAAITSAMEQEAPTTVAQQQQQNAAALAIQQQNAAALQAASMANAAATAAIGGMINGVPGSVPIGIPGVPVSATPGGMHMGGMTVNVNADHCHGHGIGVGGHAVGHGLPVVQAVAEPTLAQAVASAAAVAAASHQSQIKQEEGGVPNSNNKEEVVAAAGSAPPLDQSVEV